MPFLFWKAIAISYKTELFLVHRTIRGPNMNRIILGSFFLFLVSFDVDYLSADKVRPDQDSPKGPSEFTKHMHDQVPVSYTHLTLPTNREV